MINFFEPLESAEAIQRVARGFQFSRVLLTAVELDLFTAIANGAATSELVASECETDPRATNRLMNALVAMGLLEKTAGTFKNTAAAETYLVRDSENYMSGLHHTNHLWDTWSHLTDAAKTGTRVKTTARKRGDDEWEENFIEAMHARAKATADNLISLLDLKGVLRVLDVGGGSGVFTMAFLRASGDIRATVLDLPSVIERARLYIEREGLLGRVDLVPGDLHVTDLGTGYDVVFISAILHMLSPADCQSLISRAAAALNAGGQVVVSDFIMDDARLRPPQGTLFALNMLVATERGDSYTEAEIREWMAQAGLAQIKRIDTNGVNSLMIGRKV